ncbi:MAG: hypothetical protein HYU66_24175, partial [Armatimonadetes bacterium]|nr:hypothetical protein [Armatimonadota bacterium]
MSFYSSLILFHPGKPPQMRGTDLHELAVSLRDAVGVTPSSNASVSLKWGRRIDQDYERTNEMEWDESGMVGHLRSFPWDVKHFNVPWDAAWPSPFVLNHSIYRAYVSLGDLTKPAIESLAAADPAESWSRIEPDCAAIEINPICPVTLSSEQRVCTGLLAVKFAGYGLFTWRSLAEYAAQYAVAPPVLEARRICRERYPV